MKIICVALVAVFLAVGCVKLNGSPPTPSPNSATPAPDVGTAAEREAAIAEAAALSLQYRYAEAREALSRFDGGDASVKAALSELQSTEASLVNYEGELRHIFFHSLIVYPEMIFKDRDTPMGGYNSGFSEKAELERILPQLYGRGYVLYDLNECFEKIDGRMQRKPILLPPGKTPLILSVDDVAYAYGNGYAQKLTLNDEGELVNLVLNPEGKTVELPDGDVFGVVDAFVREHPDFSYRGHKGTLAMTGYQGAFGYSLDTADGQAQIVKVAEALKADGWNFASHSYTHNRDNYYGPGSRPENIKSDIDRWMTRVAPYLGKTRLFIAPFGYSVKQPGLQSILDAGFEIYCTVDGKVVNELYDDYALMSRIEIGGYSMTYYKNLLNEKFFNVDEVFDKTRPPVV
ncbi:MAG: hypothetical protein RR314_07105 [Oscillospiraceae bacterium]